MSSTAEQTRAVTLPGDLALARAVQAWDELGRTTDRSQSPSLWARFAPHFRERLATVWSEASRLSPEAARQSLLQDQRDFSRFNPLRVHPSWFIRILEAESPAVRWLVATRAPEPIRSLIANWLASFGDPDAIPKRTQSLIEADPEAASWAMTLWTERLVGGSTDCSNDPPIILVLSMFSMRQLVRLVRAIGQAKHAFAIEGQGPTSDDEILARTIATDRVRIGYFRRTIGRADPRLIPIARRDFMAAGSDPRRKHAILGLITVARLLKAADVHRARWAIQHIPYSIAKQISALGLANDLNATGLPPRAIGAWETWVLEAAWARLLSEGRLQSSGERDQP